MTDNNGSASAEFMGHVSTAGLSAKLLGLILSVRDLDGRIQASAMTGDQVKEAFAEMYPPAELFDAEIRAMPAIYPNLRDWLNKKGANLTPHSSRRIVMTLATSLYSENEDTVAATEIARSMIARGRSSGQASGSVASAAAMTDDSGRTTGDGNGTHKMAHNIAMRFRDSSSKFSGDIGESWMEFVAEYQQVARDYSLTPTQKLQFLHNLLRGDAKRFYLDRVDSHVSNFTQAVEMISMEYNSVVRQNRVKNYLNGVRLNKFVKDGLNESEALEKVYKLITKLSPQVPQSHRGDAHKIEFLRNATVGCGWATEPLSRIATHRLTFQQLYGELEAALHLEKEAKLAIMRDNISPTRRMRDEDESNVPGILFQGQGQYANPHKGIGSRPKNFSPTRPQAPQTEQFDPLSVMGCFNCDDPNHTIKNCSKPIDVTKAAKKKMEYYAKKSGSNRNAHIVLFELCKQLEISSDDVDSDGDEHDNKQLTEDITDVDLFDALVSYTETRPVAGISGTPAGINIIDCPAEVHVVVEGQEPFNGACFDTGAQKSVVGRNQAEAYYRYVGIPLVIKTGTPQVYKFGSETRKSIGKAKFRIPYASSRKMVIELDVVDINVPLLIGLDVMDEYNLMVDTVDNRLVCKDPPWSTPLTRKLGHVYYEWAYEIMYSEQELKRIHRHFYHPQPERIYSLMRRAGDPNADSGTLQMLDKLTRECDVCQRLSEQPGRFRVSLPNEDIVFNRLVLMDLMKLESKTVLHIICKDTLFSVAVFLLSGETTRDVWQAYVRYWVNPYVGYSQCIHADQGPQFQSDEWRNLLQSCGISRHDSGIESHNALGVGERYHEFLRQIFRKVRAEHPTLPLEDTLSLAVNAMNCTAGPDGLSPTLLVFGVMPQFPSGFSDLPGQRQRMKAMKVARSEMVKTIATSRLKTASRRNVPSAADNELMIGMDVLVYKERPVNQWVGPYKVVAGDNKNVWINVEGRLKLVSVDKVKEYRQAYEEKLDISSALPPSGAGPSGVNDDVSEMDRIFDRVLSGEVFLSQLQKGFSVLTSSTEDTESAEETPIHIHVTEVIEKEDPRATSLAFEVAKQAEIDGLKARNTWSPVKKSSVGKNANIIGGRFVLTLKNDDLAKARYVGQGFKDYMKPFIVHNSPTLRQSSTKVIVSVAAIKSFRLSHLDVTQAYLQSKDKFSREIYLQPRSEDLKYFGIKSDETLLLEKPLYGICDAGDYWGATFSDHVKNELKMEPLHGDPSLYMKVSGSEMIGLLGCYVDDSMFAGNKEFNECIKKTKKKFETKPIQWDNFEFVGVSIRTKRIYRNVPEFEISQPDYVDKLRELPLDMGFEIFRSARAAVGWLAHSRPDICCALNRAAQVTEKIFRVKHITELNDAIMRVKQSRDISLKYRLLASDSLHLRVYADASFASNEDSSSQLGYIVLLCDEWDQCHVLAYSSRKSKRVVRSIMAGEVYAFSAAFDHAFIIKHDLEKILGRRIPLSMFTDSKQIFDVITRASHTTEKRLMIDIAAAREAYNRYEISNVGLVSGEDNPADGLTKPNYCESLFRLISTGFDCTPVVQWVYRFGNKDETTTSDF